MKDNPSPWVSPIHPVPKANKGEIRLTVDMRAPNKAIQRERHVIPTVDDITAVLSGSTVFSKLDLNAGYHQLKLDESSRYITTFSTHLGLFRYKRLNFGISCASEIFQNTIADVLGGIPGVINVSDDILVYGKTQSEHDHALQLVLQRLREKNLTLNASKCEFAKSSIEFFGHVFSGNGLSPDPRKVNFIKKCKAPESKEELHSLLGMTTYLGRFISNLSKITEPLRRLLTDSAKWHWGVKEEQAFQNVKDSLS